MREWESRFHDHLIVIGDAKTPPGWECGAARYLSLELQSKLPLELLAFTPENQYVRKNIGYLQAMLFGADCVFETDDDNAPTAAWGMRDERCEASLSACDPHGWCNIYSLFDSGVSIWPRGLPLNKIKNLSIFPGGRTSPFPIQQGLANGNPDVDAIWRLTCPVEDVKFSKKVSMALDRGTWCPFNSQSTWWFPSAFPLMYLPIHATFRMTDIWRSFVAQRCLWEMGGYVLFHSPAEVVQERNLHNLMDDFKDEIPGYLHNEAIAKALDETQLDGGSDLITVCKNLRTCYETMVSCGFLPPDELKSVDAWISDVRRVAYRPDCKN